MILMAVVAAGAVAALGYLLRTNIIRMPTGNANGPGMMGGVSGTDMVNPDFADLVRAFGGHGETVKKTEEFAPAFQRAVASGKVAIIDLKVDPEALTTRATLSEIRAQALKKQAAQ